MLLNLPEAAKVSQKQRGLAKLSKCGPQVRWPLSFLATGMLLGVLQRLLRGALLTRGQAPPPLSASSEKSSTCAVFSERFCNMQGGLLFIKSEIFVARVRNQERTYQFALG